MPDEPEATFTLSVLLANAGGAAQLGMLAGLVVAVRAAVAARRRAARHTALALFCAAWIPILPMLLQPAPLAGDFVAATTIQWGQPAAAELLAVLRPSADAYPRASAAAALCAPALFLALAASAAALARSRRFAPQTAAST